MRKRRLARGSGASRNAPTLWARTLPLWMPTPSLKDIGLEQDLLLFLSRLTLVFIKTSRPRKFHLVSEPPPSLFSLSPVLTPSLYNSA